MARWRLTAPHYISVGTHYRFTEMLDGQSAEQNLPVPRLLDPGYPSDHNDREYGIVVAHTPGQRKDYIFVGDPTPDMEPLDEEAEAITGALRAKWARRNDMDLNGSEDYGKLLVDKLMSAPPSQTDSSLVKILEGQNAILAQLAGALTPHADAGVRRL